MRRSTLLVLIVLGAAIAGFAFSSATVRSRDDTVDTTPSEAAGPQTAELRWRETYGEGNERFVFEVERFEVLEHGWAARLTLTNDTSVSYEVGDPEATLDRAFGLRLFATGSNKELARRQRQDTLPKIRLATRFEPALPRILEPRASWRGTISASGALVAGSWVRIVFGWFLAVGKPPEGVEANFVWTTDHAYPLRR